MRGTTLDASGPVRIRLGRRSCQARARRRLVQQLRYSQSDWTSFWGLHSSYAIGPKRTEIIGGRTRIFDGLNGAAVSEVKNVRSQAYTQQLRDDVAYAQANGLRFDLYVRSDTYLTGPLRSADLDPLNPLNIRHIP